jgi:hypothetical protein
MPTKRTYTRTTATKKPRTTSTISTYKPYYKRNYDRSHASSVASNYRSLTRNYFKTHIAGAPQTFNQTLRFNWVSYFTNTYSTYQEPFIAYMNSAYQPLTGTTTNYAAGYGKYIGMYSKCVVKAAKIKFTVANQAGAENVLFAGVTITTNTTSLGSMNLAITDGLCSWGTIIGSPDSKSFVLSIDCKKYFGVDDLMDGSQFYSTNAGQPAQYIIAHPWFYNQNGITSNIQVQYNVTIDFECCFYDPYPIT